MLIFTACQQDDDQSFTEDNQETIPDTFSQYFGNEINRDFIGNVIDENDNPISGVSISIGNDTATTDDNGVFIINDASVKERFAYIKAEKPGYIHGSRSVTPSTGVNKVSIMLLEENVAGTINSGSSETVSLPNGSSVSFDGNFIKPDGTAYSGSVDVIMQHLDPTDENMNLQMPGMLYAENQDGAERMLQSFGMLAVELRGAGGEDLNLAEGSTAEISIPLDASLLSTAPQTIPLWYFDEAHGYWKEEGQATLQGNAYVGEVSHFSFWNCDIPVEASIICINVLSDDGIPLANLVVSITSENYGTTIGFTNANGEVCGYVPNNESLSLGLFNAIECVNPSVNYQTIGPFSEDDNLTIDFQQPNVITETITGTFIACDNSPIENGYVKLNYKGISFYEFVSNGDFEFTFIRCLDENIFSIVGYDFDNVQTTGEISFTFTTPNTNLGALSACNAVAEIVSLSVDSVYDEVFFGDFQVSVYDTVNYNFPSLELYNISEMNDCFFMYGRFNDVTPIGNYDGIDNNINDTGFSLNYEGCFPFDLSDNNVNYNVTNFGNVGEYIDINISGTVKDTLNVTRNVTGTIHVLRDE